MNDALVRRHLVFGWGALAVFLVGGIALESFHGFKLGFYLDVDVEVRRTMWRLAHSHGALLALINVAFAWTLTRVGEWPRAERTSALLRGGTVLVPGGFFLGGVWIHGGDPGLGVLLTPIGALMLLVAVVWTASAARSGG